MLLQLKISPSEIYGRLLFQLPVPGELSVLRLPVAVSCHADHAWGCYLQPALFGGRTDGKGQCLVYYFTLPEGWEPSDVDNKAALGLLQRFIHDGREADGCACSCYIVLRPIPCTH